MTSEAPKLTEPWIEKHKAEYAYGYESGKLFSQTGGKGLPHAVLVDPQGIVVWTGHPGSLTPEIIRPALAGALKTPVYEWPENAAKVRKAFLKGKLAQAREEAEALGESGAMVQGAIKTVIANRLAALKAAHEAKDWLTVSKRGERLADQFDGLPEAAEVSTYLESLKDGENKKVLKAQEKIEKIFAERIKKRDIPKLKKDLQKIAEDFPDTAAARDAESGLEELDRLLQEKD